MAGPVEVSLDSWAASKPTPMELKQEDIDYIHELLTKVGEKCEELGTSFSASFVTRINGVGASQLQSRIGVTLGTLTPEIWCSLFLQTGGLDNLLDNLESLMDAANDRHEVCTKLSLITKPTSIILP